MKLTVTYLAGLIWPVGQPRTVKPKGSTLKADWVKLPEQLRRELELLGGVTEAIVSGDWNLGRSGLPLSNGRSTDAPGIALRMVRNGQTLDFGVDIHETQHENFRGLVLALENLRGLERYAGTWNLDKAVAAFLALPPAARPWHEVLGVATNAPLAVIKAAYKALSNERHPDKGGTAEAFAELNAAYERALHELNP